ncbi:hypothetical protein B5M09_006961 [Aphanomyces astaci]|uniref:Uncharacterized protein n=1 Tax=Aphanomyces astaci TaxID=112090 RepID=A0A425DEW1_APHAT|nr:hypothetical protein B5M09_006961 [Aphanomyces astaci]
MRYMDHLIHNDNRQDPGSVLALMELILLQVKTEFPTTAMASFQSDNASTYQNQFLPLYLKDISMSTGIKIKRYISFELDRLQLMVKGKFTPGVLSECLPRCNEILFCTDGLNDFSADIFEHSGVHPRHFVELSYAAMVRHDNEVREARFATKVAKKAAVAEARKRKIQTKQAEVQVRRAAKRPHYVGAAFVQVVAVKDGI